MCSKFTWFEWICELITKKIGHSMGFNFFASYNHILTFIFLLQDTVAHIQRTEKHAPKEFSIRSKSITNLIVTSWATKIALLSSIWWQTGIMELSQVKVHIPDSICVFVLFSKNTLRKIPKRKNCKWKTNIPRQSCAVTGSRIQYC